MASLRVTTNSGNVLASVNLPDTALPVIREVLGLGATATNQEVAAAFLAYIVERLKPEFKAAGTSVEVVIRGRAAKAEVARLPFYRK